MSSTNEELAVSEKDKGNRAFREGNLGLAINFYNRGLQYNPNNEFILSNRAMVFIKLEMFNEAMMDATKSISLNNRYAKAFHRRAVALIGLGKPEDSFEDYKRILELEPLNEAIRKEFDALAEQAANAILNENLIIAMKTRKLNKFVNLLRNSNQDQINAKMLFGTWKGATLLHLACQFNNFKVVEILLQIPIINPNPKDDDGDTPIMVAAIGHDDNVQALKEMLDDQRVILDFKNSAGQELEDLGNYCQNPELCLVRKMIIDEKEKRRIRSNIQNQVQQKGNNFGTEKPAATTSEMDVSVLMLKENIGIKQKAANDAVLKFQLDVEAFDKKLIEMKENQRKEACKIASIDGNINRLEKDLSTLKDDKESANKVVVKIEKKIETLKSNKDQKEICFNSEQSKLKKEIENLKIITENSEKKEKENLCGDDTKRKGEMVLLEFLNESIAKLEKELECPVCKERSQIPIFQCTESHIICFKCRPKLEQCPECRKHYPKQLKRHRYAEKDLVELGNLIKKKKAIESGLKPDEVNKNEKIVKQTRDGSEMFDKSSKSSKFVENSTETTRVQDSQQVWIGSIPSGTQEHHLGKLFNSHGRVVDVAIITPQHSPSFGFVSFDSTETVNRVLREEFWMAGTRLVVRRKWTKKN